MPVAAELRSLEIDLPARPEAVLRLAALLASDEPDLRALMALVEADMALAAAVMKAVGASVYGLRGRVQNVRQAVTYLGLREIAAITYAFGLRAVFPSAPALEAIWSRAARRGRVMVRLAALCGADPWAAHSAGLFEECGKAVLFRHAPTRYPALLATATDDGQLCELEHAAFGARHDALGAALCVSWDLEADAVAMVRHHVAAQAGHALPALPPSQHRLLRMSAVASALVSGMPPCEAALAGMADEAGMAADALAAALEPLRGLAAERAD